MLYNSFNIIKSFSYFQLFLIPTSLRALFFMLYFYVKIKLLKGDSMKTFFKFVGIFALALIILAYLAFLFVLPRKIDLSVYKEQIQELALKQAHLSVDYNDLELVTTPALEAGIKLKDFTVKLPDGSLLLSADGFKTKVSLPNLFLLTVRVSEVSIDNPKINVEIEPDGSQYKVVRVIEDIINEQKQKQETVSPETTSWFNPAWIKIKVPNVKISNYSILINDLKSKHYLTLKGDELKAGYFNGKTFKVKTKSEFLSDEDVKITADIALNSFIPPKGELDEEDDDDYRADIAFVNPVLLYRDYDIKSDITAKIKARQNKEGKVTLNGFADVENITMNLSGYQLPESYFRAKFKGDKAILDTNIYLAKNENFMLNGLVKYGKKPKLDLTVNSTKIYFNDMLTVAKAFMDTLRVKNDLNLVKATGYLSANAKIKTNFKKLKSNGAIVVRNGGFSNENLGLKNINANVIFNDKSMSIEDTYLYVNNSILKAEGKIDEKSVADISIFAEKLPLPALFATFAPVDLKKAFNITSGNLFLDIKLTGELKKALSNIEANLTDFNLVSKDNSLNVANKDLKINLASDFKTLAGKISNSGLNVLLPPTKSSVKVPETDIIIDEENVSIKPFAVNLNNASTINVKGLVSQYIKKPEIELTADGSLNSADLKQFLGKAAEPFIKVQGSIPMKLNVKGNAKKQDLICQIKADKLNFITPVDIQSVQGLQSILQAKVSFKGNRLKIKDTGLYTKSTPTPFSEDYDANMAGANPVMNVNGTISRLDTSSPFINLITVKVPQDLKMQICAFKNSNLDFGGNLLVFGQAASPKYRGKFSVWDLSIPDLYITMKNLGLDFSGRTLNFKIEDLLLNGSDIQVDGSASLVPASTFLVNNLDVKSSNIDVEKLMKVSDAAMKYAPPSSPNAQPADIPVRVANGSIDLKRISAPPVLLENTTGRISLVNNIFYLNNLYTSTLGGRVTGDVSANLLTMLLKAQVKGENFDVERTFLELMNMKDTLSGTMEFSTDLEINGAAKTQEEQMKGIKGTVDFEILKGQLGPFGKLENLILAENIRESEFFQTALGGVINSLTQIQTSHFDILTGHVKLKDGIASLDPIASRGPVMCMNISGDMNLLDNQADMKLRARLGSKIADMLGPIAAVNPINLVKATPGLNVAAAKMFAIFCEEVTQAEMDAIPQFEENFGVMSTTNFQIVLRGDTQKPLSLIKSFKWLATVDEINSAEQFVDTLPPPDAANPTATLEEIQAQMAEAEKLKNENFFQKSLRKIKEFFKR